MGICYIYYMKYDFNQKQIGFFLVLIPIFYIFILLNSQIVGAVQECEYTNVYRTLNPQFGEYLLDRSQSFGTCYAESSSFAYNLKISDKKNTIHPLAAISYLVSSVNKKSVDGGVMGEFNLINKNPRVCSFGKISSHIELFREWVNSQLDLNLSSKRVESDFLLLMQVIYLVRDAKLTERNFDLYKIISAIEIKSKEAIYLNMDDYLNSIYLSMLNSEMKRDNTMVNIVYPILEEKSLYNSMLDNFQKVVEFYYKKNFIYSPRKSFLDIKKIAGLITNALNRTSVDSFYKFLNAYFDGICNSESKVSIEPSYFTNEVKNINKDRSLSDIIFLLKTNHPILLAVDAKVLDRKNSGSHRVVLLGTKSTRYGSCRVLLRNSWGRVYPESSECECYDKASNSFKTCFLGNNSIGSDEVLLGCWHNASTVIEASTLYQAL